MPHHFSAEIKNLSFEPQQFSLEAYNIHNAVTSKSTNEYKSTHVHT
jgi:hypothetical protein